MGCSQRLAPLDTACTNGGHCPAKCGPGFGPVVWFVARYPCLAWWFGHNYRHAQIAHLLPTCLADCLAVLCVARASHDCFGGTTKAAPAHSDLMAPVSTSEQA